jgi:hypothetical protein
VIAWIGPGEGIAASNLLAIDDGPRVKRSLRDEALDLREAAENRAPIAFLAEVEQGLICKG